MDATEQKPEQETQGQEQGPDKPKEASAVYGFEEPTEEHPARFVMRLDLDKMNRTFARGLFLDASDLVLRWYSERAKSEKAAKDRVLVPRNGMAATMRNFLRRK